MSHRKLPTVTVFKKLYFEQHKWNSMNALVMEVKISEADISKPPQVKQQLCAWWTDPLISYSTAFVKSLSGVIWNKQPLHYGYRDAGTVTPTSNSNQERKTAHSVSVRVCVWLHFPCLNAVYNFWNSSWTACARVHICTSKMHNPGTMSTSEKPVCARAQVCVRARALSAGAPLQSKSSETTTLQLRYDSQNVRASMLECVQLAA